MFLNNSLNSKSTNKKNVKPRYGYYYFKPYMVMLLVFLMIGCGLSIIGVIIKISLLIGCGVFLIFYGIFTTLGWVLARYVIPGNRIMFARNVINSLGLSGSEKVLDVGSGRGLYAIEAAKKLTEGKVIGIDIWESDKIEELTYHHRLSQPTGNTISNAERNAQIEGVLDKIEFISMDANHLKFDSHSFDVVVCGFVIGHLWQFGPDILDEIRRVLKSEGRLVLIDSFRDLTYLLLSTPHLFILSYLKNKKARWFTKKNWFSLISSAGFKIKRVKAKRSILVVEAKA
jgi:ubiquinone/menaquinone biosynthesis C-methylase UbiE